MAYRVTSAFAVFSGNIDRSQAFIRIFDGPSGRGKGQPSNDEKELLRGAVVFAVGALDAYLHELILEIVPKFGGDRDNLRDALRAIAKDDPSLSLRVALAPDQVSRSEEFGSALDQWLSTKSFQGPEAVVRAMSFVGCDLTWQNLNDASGADAAARLKHFTDMRHDIVHRGRKPYIKRAQAEECIELTQSIATSIDREISETYLT